MNENPDEVFLYQVDELGVHGVFSGRWLLVSPFEYDGKQYQAICEEALREVIHATSYDEATPWRVADWLVEHKGFQRITFQGAFTLDSKTLNRAVDQLSAEEEKEKEK